MCDYGTLLQDAVVEGKTDFVRIMLESGFVCIDYDLVSLFCISTPFSLSGLTPLLCLM